MKNLASSMPFGLQEEKVLVKAISIVRLGSSELAEEITQPNLEIAKSSAFSS